MTTEEGNYASVNSSGAHSPPPGGISGAFFLIVRPGDQALVYPGAFDSLVIFMSQYCHFLSVVSLWGKDDKFVINFV